MSIPPFLALPPGARRRTLTVPAGTLAAVDATPSPGPARGTALLVPGFTGSKEDFVGVLAPLTAVGWRVVAVDQRGQFESPGGGPPADYSLPSLAADVVAVADLLRRDDDAGPVHLLGHSLGGLVARAAVLAEPDRWASLALVASGPAAVPPAVREPFDLLRQVLPTATMAQVWDAKEARDRAAGVPPPPPDVHAFLHRRWLATDPVSLAAMADILCEEPDRVAALGEVVAAHRIPVAVVCGDGDDAWPPAWQADMAGRLGATFDVLPGVGHSPAAEAPGPTAAVLDRHWRTATAR